MIRDEVLNTLRAHEDELRQAGIAGLSLFGSVARGDETPSGDVDVAVRVDPAALATGFA